MVGAIGRPTSMPLWERMFGWWRLWNVRSSLFLFLFPLICIYWNKYAYPIFYLINYLHFLLTLTFFFSFFVFFFSNFECFMQLFWSPPRYLFGFRSDRTSKETLDSVWLKHIPKVKEAKTMFLRNLYKNKERGWYKA